jgi:hypothetical protein
MPVNNNNSITKDMRYDIFQYDIEAEDFDILNRFPELKKIESFASYRGSASELSVNRNKLITYIILAYSHDSPLNQGVKDSWGERMYKAADYAGFTSKKDLDHLEQTVFNLHSEIALLMVVEYLEYQSRMDWAEWCVLQHELRENTMLRLAPISESKDKDQMIAMEKKSKFMEYSNKTKDAIREVELKVFGDIDRLLHVKSAREYTTIEKLVKSKPKR